LKIEVLGHSRINICQNATVEKNPKCIKLLGSHINICQNATRRDAIHRVSPTDPTSFYTLQRTSGEPNPFNSDKRRRWSSPPKK